MTDKIINGIDVSECKYYDDGICCNEDVLALICDKTDCIYNQLKRLQKLQKENEELKKYQYTQEYLQSEIEKRQKALEETRKIINSVKNEYINTKNKELALYHTELNGALSVAESIEDEINEVLNDRD